MDKRRFMIAALILVFSISMVATGLAGEKKGPRKIEPGTVKGRIDRIDPNYHKFGAQGWIIVKWDVEKPKEIDRRLLVVGGGSQKGDGIACPMTRQGQCLTFQDLEVGMEVEADFRMGYDALHCTAVRVLGDASNPAGIETPASTEQNAPSEQQ
jgi:hypothetical protein